MTRVNRKFLRLMLISMVVAFVSLAAPYAFNMDLGPFLLQAGICSVICTGLLLWGLIDYRLKGLWLVLPLAITLYWPITFGISYRQCAAEHGGICPL